MSEYVVDWHGIGVDIMELLEEQASPMEAVMRIKPRRGEEIVRCKDCIHRSEEKKKHVINADLCDALMIYMPDDGFCSMGRRKPCP